MNPVANHGADAEFAHFASRISDNPVFVVQQDRKSAIGQDFFDLPFKGEQRFFCQGNLLSCCVNHERRENPRGRAKKHEKEDETRPAGCQIPPQATSGLLYVGTEHRFDNGTHSAHACAGAPRNRILRCQADIFRARKIAVQAETQAYRAH